MCIATMCIAVVSRIADECIARTPTERNMFCHSAHLLCTAFTTATTATTANFISRGCFFQGAPTTGQNTSRCRPGSPLTKRCVRPTRRCVCLGVLPYVPSCHHLMANACCHNVMANGLARSKS
jgi:hypothetical protein